MVTASGGPPMGAPKSKSPLSCPPSASHPGSISPEVNAQAAVFGAIQQALGCCEPLDHTWCFSGPKGETGLFREPMGLKG